MLCVIVHAYASVAVNERRTYIATQEGCHTIFLWLSAMVMCKHTKQEGLLCC